MSPGLLGGAGHTFTGGSFSLGGLDSAPKNLFIWAPGYMAACEPLHLNPGEERQVDIRLQPTPPLEGRVVDGQGQPVAAARLYADATDFPIGLDYEEAERGTQYYDALTRGDGTFSIETFLPGTDKLFAFKQGYALGSVDVPENSDARRALSIVLAGGGTIEGRVTLGGQSPGSAASPRGHPAPSNVPTG